MIKEYLDELELDGGKLSIKLDAQNAITVIQLPDGSGLKLSNSDITKMVVSLSSLQKLLQIAKA